jgi:hypothetical protein
VEDDPAYEVRDLIEAIASEYRTRREEELSALQAQFSDRANQLAEAIGVKPDEQKIEKPKVFDEAVVVARWEKEGEAFFRAAVEVGLDPTTVAEEIAATLGLERPPSLSGAFFAFDVGERG